MIETKLTFSNFCLASLMTFNSSSFLVLVYDLVIVGGAEVPGLPDSLLCLALILRRPSKY